MLEGHDAARTGWGKDMKARITDADALTAISPASLGAFARAEGWERRESYADKADVYVRSGLPELLVPRHSRLGDYPNVVAQLIAIFADALGADELAIYRDLVCADRDVVRVRASEGIDDGAIDLEAGVRLVTQAKEMLLSAACAVKSPQPFYRAGANREAAEYLHRVKLGQTEHGSFVVTMLSPVPPQIQPELDPAWAALEDEPPERAVTRRLMDALQNAQNAAELAISGQAGAFDEAVSYGVSANLCEAVSELITLADGIEVSTTWARTRPTPEAQRKVQFSVSEAETLREAARVFRLKEPRPDVALYGWVTKLNRPETAEQGQVTVKTFIDDKMQSVSATLDDELYRLALKAHDDRTPIILRGDLERAKSRWQVVHPDVQIVAMDIDEDAEG